jgi:hypothetical protein
MAKYADAISIVDPKTNWIGRWEVKKARREWRSTQIKPGEGEGEGYLYSMLGENCVLFSFLTAVENFGKSAAILFTMD